MVVGWGLDHDGTMSNNKGALGTVVDEFLLNSGEQDQGKAIDKTPKII